jgi:hypothetical protein
MDTWLSIRKRLAKTVRKGMTPRVTNLLRNLDHVLAIPNDSKEIKF